jgi:hypothetical protein
MKPKISIVSLGVVDLRRALAFYRDGLGFPTHNYTDGDDYIMFRLEGSWLSLTPRDEAPNNLPRGARPSFGLSHNVGSPAEVDQVFEAALAVGATAIKRPQPAEWGGYEANFADPDGHLWDIAYNPFTDLT